MTIVNFFDLNRGQAFKVKNSNHTFCLADAAHNTEDKLGTIVLDCDAKTFFTVTEFLLWFNFYDIDGEPNFGVEF